MSAGAKVRSCEKDGGGVGEVKEEEKGEEEEGEGEKPWEPFER
jgi:hypothetical protein